jgi:protein-arginine kinase activator protein McsA
MLQRTFVAIKPATVKRGLIGEIIRRFERKQYKIVAMKMLTVDREMATKHYEEHIGKPFFEELSILKEDTYKLSLFLSGTIIKCDQLGRKIYNYDLCSKCPMFKNCHELNEYRIEKFGNLIKDFRNITSSDVAEQVNELCNTCYLLSKEYASITESEEIDKEDVDAEDLTNDELDLLSLDDLNEILNMAVKEEKYELAVNIRDAIKRKEEK